MKRLLMIGCALAALAPFASLAGEPPTLTCGMADEDTVCKQGVPLRLPRLSCDVCGDALPIRAPAPDTKSHPLVTLCQAMHGLPLLSELPACDQLQTKLDALMANGGRTAM